MQLSMGEPERPARPVHGGGHGDLRDGNVLQLPLPSRGHGIARGFTQGDVARLFGYTVPMPEPAISETVADTAPPAQTPSTPRPRPAQLTAEPKNPDAAPAHSRRRSGPPTARPRPVRHFHHPAAGRPRRDQVTAVPAPATTVQRARAALPIGVLHQVVTRLTSLLLVLSLLVGWAVLGLTIAQHVWGYNTYVVLSGSMRPTIPVGTLVFDQRVPGSEVVIGDIISFHPPGNPSTTITHRVVRVQQNPPGAAPGLYAKTKGDANPVEDTSWIPLNSGVNRVAMWIPDAGYAINWAELPGTRVLLVLVPLALMAMLALSALWRSPR